MCIVFAGFVLARVLAVKETGVALVLAIVIAVKGGDFGTTSLSVTPLTPSVVKFTLSRPPPSASV